MDEPKETKEPRSVRDERPLFHLTLQLLAQRISPEVLGWLWQVHRMYGEWDCNAHRAGQQCCVDVLLEAARPPITTHEIEIGDLAQIIQFGYDVAIESATDDRSGPVHIFLSHPDQVPSAHLLFLATPATLGQGIEKARQWARAFPAAPQAVK
jgi:hypothetical protein